MAVGVSPFVARVSAKRSNAARFRKRQRSGSRMRPFWAVIPPPTAHSPCQPFPWRTALRRRVAVWLGTGKSLSPWLWRRTAWSHFLTGTEPLRANPLNLFRRRPPALPADSTLPAALKRWNPSAPFPSGTGFPCVCRDGGRTRCGRFPVSCVPVRSTSTAKGRLDCLLFFESVPCPALKPGGCRAVATVQKMGNASPIGQGSGSNPFTGSGLFDERPGIAGLLDLLRKPCLVGRKAMSSFSKGHFDFIFPGNRLEPNATASFDPCHKRTQDRRFVT